MSRHKEKAPPVIDWGDVANIIARETPPDLVPEAPALTLDSLPLELLHQESGLGWVRTPTGWRLKD